MGYKTPVYKRVICYSVLGAGLIPMLVYTIAPEAKEIRQPGIIVDEAGASKYDKTIMFQPIMIDAANTTGTTYGFY